MNKEEIEQGFKLEPDVLVCQGTSSDTGPGYVATAVALHGPEATADSLSFLLARAREKEIPFIISVGGPSGTDERVTSTLRLVGERLKKMKIKLRVAVISGQISKEYLKSKLREGAVTRRIVEHPRLPDVLSAEDVDRSATIVSQMGPEPVMKALDLDVDGVIAGRSLDSGLHMAMPMRKGFDKGLAAHMAKTIECGGVCTEMGEGLVFGTLRKDHFLVRPVNPANRCTVTSVAAHSFYERSDIAEERNPGGLLNITDAKFEQYDERTVRVSGARWIPQKYTVKLEGVARVGFRTIAIAGVRDPILIRVIDEFLEEIKKRTRKVFADISDADYQLLLHVYGKNGVMRESEPHEGALSHELCVLVEVVAKTQELANAIVQFVRNLMNHMNYRGRTTTAANVAWPFSPLHIPFGEVYVYNIWHTLELDDPCEPFRQEVLGLP